MHSFMSKLLVCLRLNGLNPFFSGRIYFIIMFLNFSSVIGVFLFNALQLILKWEGVETIGEAHLISSTLIFLCKFSYLIVYQKKLRRFIETVEKFWKYDKFGEEHEKRISAILGRTMTAIKVLISAIFGTAVSMIVAVVRDRGIIFPGYDICDLKTNPCYPLHMAWQVFYTFYELLPIVGAFDGLFVCFIGYAYCDLEMIKVALKQMPLVIRKNDLPPAQREETDAEKMLVRNSVMEIVEEHAQVMQFIKELNEFYSPMMLLHQMSSLFSLVFCLYMMGLQGMPPSFDAVAKYGILLLTVCLQFLTFCYSGSVILEQSLTLDFNIFDVDWTYKTQPDLRRALMLMIQRAQLSRKLKIGDMNDLNLESFLSVIRNGVSLVTLIQTMSGSNRMNGV